MNWSTVNCGGLSKNYITRRMREAMYGNFGTILFVDLNSRRIESENLAPNIYRDYLGGYGLAVKMLYERMPAGVDPLGPDNILGFTTGTLVGTPAPSGLRFTVSAKSPLTGTWGDSNCGGYFGPALRSAGLDGIFIRGSSEQPVYLFIDDGRAELRDAGHLWGKDTTETEDLLKQELGHDVQVACIGPAGEQLSMIAAIIHDKGRAAGRSGLGAVMGSKKLKAVVVRGSQEVPMADKGRAKELRRKWVKALLAKPSAQKFRKYGTIDHVASSTFSNDAPVCNWVGVGVRDFPQAELISDDRILAYEVKKYACWQCPLACSGYYTVREGPYAVQNAHKPEYETCGMFGPNLLNDNIESIIKINDICNRAGVDTISAGATIGFAIECFEKGLIRAEDLDGIEPTWGNHAAIMQLTERLCFRQGKAGELLADGTRAAANKIGHGSEKWAVHVGGQELPAHDPRYGPGWGTYYVVDATPGRHTQGGQNSYENGKGIEGLALPKLQKYRPENRGEVAARTHNIFHALHSLGLCRQVLLRMNINAWLEFLEAVTGEAYTLELLEKIGARIGAMRQAFNLREGIPVTKITIPARAYTEPLDGGPLQGVVLDIETQIKEYYEYQGWEPETGRPARSRLKELGLEALIRDLY